MTGIDPRRAQRDACDAKALASMPSEARELMTSDQARRFVGFGSKTTLIKWAERGLIPAMNVAGRWWFRRRELERWLEGREGVR